MNAALWGPVVVPLTPPISDPGSRTAALPAAVGAEMASGRAGDWLHALAINSVIPNANSGTPLERHRHDSPYAGPNRARRVLHSGPIAPRWLNGAAQPSCCAISQAIHATFWTWNLLARPLQFLAIAIGADTRKRENMQ
jgi:hypothetical protein